MLQVKTFKHRNIIELLTNGSFPLETCNLQLVTPCIQVYFTWFMQSFKSGMEK